MDGDDRYVYGPRPVGSLMPRITRPAFRRRAPATAQVLADWTDIVGPAIAAVTTPRRLSRGTLTIACSGPIAMELQHLAGEVMARINVHLGAQTVSALRFVQTLDRAAAPVARPAAPDADTLARVEASLVALPDGDLRNALAALGRSLASRPSTPRAPRR